MAKDDFFLSFGTDADVFANKIVSESDRASSAILHLTEALEDYDATVKNAKTGGPLQSLFGALDEAAGRFGSLTSELVTGFDRALAGVGELTSELAGLVDAVNKINELKPAARRKTAQAVNEVGNDDIVATDNARRAGRALGEVVELNATMARNALMRVAHINNTLARSANDAADPVSRLAKSIRELSGAAKEGNGRNVVGLIGGGGGGPITITGPVTIATDGTVINAPSAVVPGAKVVAPQTDQQADAAVVSRSKRTTPLEDLSQPASPGLYTYPGIENYGGRKHRGGRLVSSDVREGESFGQYFARNEAVRQHIEQARSNLPKPDHEDLHDFNAFKSSGGKAKDYATELEATFRRTLTQDQSASVITAENIRASLHDLGLEQQYPALPQIIERVFRTRAEQRAEAEKAVRELIAADPAVTFGGNALGSTNSDFEVGNTFGYAVKKIDDQLAETHEGDPETLRLAQARRDARQRRSDLNAGRGQPVIDPALYGELPAAPGQEDLTLNARRKADAAARTAARKRNAAAVAALEPIDQEAVRERRKGNPELQRINEILSKQQLNVSDTAETLGLEGVTERRPAADEAALQRAAQRRELAQTRLELATNPETAAAYTERERQRIAAQEAANVGVPRHLREAIPVASAALTPESLAAALRQEMVQATSEITALTSRKTYPGLTSDSEAQARNILENRRSAILDETVRGGRSSELVDLYRLQLQGQQPITGTPESGGVTGRFFTDNKDFLHLDHNQIAEEYKYLSAEANTPLELLHAQIPKEVADKYRLRAYRERNPEATAQMDIGDFDQELLIPEHELRRHRVTATPLGAAYTQAQIEAETERAKLPNGDIDSAATAKALLDRAGKPRNLYDEDIAESNYRAPRPGPGRRLIYRGEGPEASPASGAQSGTDLRGRFFTEDLEQAQEYAGPGGRVLATSVSEKTLRRARNRAVQEKVLEGLVVSEAVAKGAGEYDPATANPETINNTPAGAGRRPSQRGALKDARARLEELKAAVAAENADVEGLQGALAAAEAEVDRLAAVRAPRTATGGSGGGQKPPRLPPNAAAASEPDPDDEYVSRAPKSVFSAGVNPKKSERSTAAIWDTDYAAQLALLQPVTRAILDNAAARLQDTRLIKDETEQLEVQNRILVEAGAAFRKDPHFKNIPGLKAVQGTFAQGVNLPPSKDNYNRVGALFTQGGGIDGSALDNRVRQAGSSVSSIKGANSPGGALGQAFFGRQGFIDAQLRHIGLAIENFAGFQLVFTGFEKLKEVVDTGIQADAVFVRLQMSIEATGRSAGNLRQQLQSVSSGTATGLKDTIEAASELTGVFKNNTDLVAGTRVATELANISEGALTAKESAVGLRDVIDAYGLTGTESVRSVGDEITRLSQVTGVSIKDVLEGTTKMAQVGRQYHLSREQSATFATFVTRNTGETGEAAAEQVDRIFSTLDSGKVQKALTSMRTKSGQTIATPQMFAQGQQGQILTNLLGQFENLDPGNQAEIRDLVSRGRQAPAFAGFIRDGKLISEQADAVSAGSSGALRRQNSAYLDTLAGQLKVLSTDFKNLGASLQQSGFFDLIGLLAKSLDEVLKITTGILNTFNQIANSNPFTKAAKDIAVVVGEVALLFKMFGGGAGQLLGRFRPGRATQNRLDRAGNIVRDSEGVAEQEFVPVTLRGAGRAVFNTPRRGLSGFTDSTAGFFAGPGVGVGPGGQRISDERAAGLSGRQRFAAARAARAESVLAGSGARGALTRTLAGDGSSAIGVGLAGVTNGVATATRGVSGHISNLSRSLVGLGRSFLGPMVAMAAFGFAIDQLVNVFERSKAIGAAANALADDLRGKTADTNKNDAKGKNADGTDKTVANDALNKDLDAQKKANRAGFIDTVVNGFLGKTLDPNSSKNMFGTYAGDNGFDRNETATNDLLNKRLRKALEVTDPKKRADALRAASTAGDKDIQGEQSFIDSLGLNHEQKANAEANLGLIRQAFQKKYADLLAHAEQLDSQETLNIQTGENLLAALNTGGNLKSETLRGDEGARTKQVILDDSQLPESGKSYKDLKAALNGDSTRARLAAQVTADDDLRKQALFILDTGAKSGPERERNRKLLDDTNTKLQTDQSSLRSLDENNPLQLSEIAEGRGDNLTAISEQMKAIKVLEATNKKIGNKDDPEYIGNLKKIQDEKKTLADLTYEGAILAAAAAAAATNDPLIKAQREYDKAVQEQKAVLARPHSHAEAEQAQATLDQANISKAQQAEDLRVAQFQQSIAGDVENTVLVNAQITENVKEQLKYSNGTLASQIKLTQLKTEEKNLRQKLAQTTADEANASLETQVAELEARGQKGDPQKAAELQVTEVRNKMHQYLAKPGAKTTDSSYQQLAGQLATARRNSFDVAFNAQVEALDFQKETYKITSSQEVQALQEMLKNKQNTYAEQMSLTLKIKGLQEGIRNQLTGSGFNIASEIKLPTINQVRRSLGGVLGNGTTQVIQANNTTTNTVEAPITIVAQPGSNPRDIANAVADRLGASTSQAVRANTPTPRLVGF